MGRVIVWALLLVACGDDDAMTPVDAGADSGATDAGDAPDAGNPGAYPAEPSPPVGAACVADQEAHWVYTVPAECAAGRLCIDADGLTYREGTPFLVRGVYHGGIESTAVLTNCPAGAPCAATGVATHDDYVTTLADGGINTLIETFDSVPAELLAAVDAEPRMFIAPVLWGDPFTMAGHDALVAQIGRAAADPNTIMWFGPDEPDLNRTWPMATGIARLLRGSNAELDALLAGRYRPMNPMPFLPAMEPAHDPNGLPYASALVIDDTGLMVGADVYDALLPVTYPLQERYSRVDDGIWSTGRASRFAQPGVPMMPVLQMVELAGLSLIRPAPDQVRAMIGSAMVQGALGSFYFKVAGDDPPFAGRAGWFAPDDAPSWAAFTEMHALQDRLVPVLYGDGTDERGMHGVLEWRRITLGDRRLLLIANPTPYVRRLDLDAIIARSDTEYVRSFTDCTPFTTRALDVPGYATWALEVVPSDAPAPGDPGDPLAGYPPPLPDPEPAEMLAGTWEMTAPLPVGRSAFALTYDGERVRLAGGYSGALTASVSAVEYDTRTGESALPTLPMPAAAASAIVTGEGLFVAGGVPRFANDGAVTALDLCHRFTAGAWSACATVGNGPTSGAASAAFDDRLFMFGGYTVEDYSMGGASVVTRVVQRFDPALDEWRAETHLPEVRIGAAAVEHRGVAYIIGGLVQTSPTAPVVGATGVAAYDMRTHTWLPDGDPRGVDALPTPRVALACAARRGYAYCTGGYEVGGDNVTTAERLDFETGRWEMITPMPVALSDHRAVALDDGVLFLGGLDTTFNDTRSAFVLR